MSAAEEWRPVAGYESLYSISSLGRVRSEQKMIVRKNGKNYQAQERTRMTAHRAATGQSWSHIK